MANKIQKPRGTMDIFPEDVALWHKIEEKAMSANLSPKAFVDNVANEIKGIWDLVGVSYDKFIRTTDEYHQAQVQKIFKKLYDVLNIDTMTTYNSRKLISSLKE